MYRLLELSLPTGQILKDMALFADLGFSEHRVNEIVPHHYGVLGDGRFHVGLHGTEFEGPTLTYVLPDVARYAPALSELDIEFERADLGDDQFNQISFFDPGRQRINLLEARTFSPTLDDDMASHKLGAFTHIELPEVPGREAFWAQLIDMLPPHVPEIADDQAEPLVRFHPDRERLTVVYKGDLEALIMHSAREGWQHFKVTADDQGLLRLPHHFDLLITSLD